MAWSLNMFYLHITIWQLLCIYFVYMLLQIFYVVTWYITKKYLQGDESFWCNKIIRVWISHTFADSIQQINVKNTQGFPQRQLWFVSTATIKPCNYCFQWNELKRNLQKSKSKYCRRKLKHDKEAIWYVHAAKQEISHLFTKLTGTALCRK